MCPSGWFFFGDRYWKHRHDNFQAIFRIVRLISNCSLKQLSPSHSHKKDVIPKFEDNFFFHKNRQWYANIVLHLWDCLLFVVGDAERKIKNKTYFNTLYFTSSFQKHFFKAFYERTNGQRFSYKKNYYRNEVYTGIT